MKDRLFKIVLPVFLAALIIFLWHLLSSNDFLNSALFPVPMDILLSVSEIQGLQNHILFSFLRLIFSVMIGYILGFVFGFIIGYNKSFGVVEDIISFFMSIPGISWAPIFIAFIGFGDKTIIAVGILTAFFPVVYNIYHGIKETDKNLLSLGDLFEYSSMKKILKIKIPSIMSFLIIALKLAFAKTWRTIIAVEMIAASTYGLGYMIYDARELLNTRVMFFGILISGLLYMLIEIVFINSLELVTVRKWGIKLSQ